MTVWGTCTSSKFHKVESRHIRETKLIKNIPRTVNPNNVLDMASWNNLGYMYNQKVAAEMYKIVEGEHALKDHFTMSSYKKDRLQAKRLRSEFE